MYDGDGMRLYYIYSAINEKIESYYGKGDPETVKRTLEYVKLNEKEMEQFNREYEELIKENEKCRKARGETREKYNPIVYDTCFDLH